MRSLRLALLALAVNAVCAASAQAENLVALYDAARAIDPTYQSAKAQYEANLAKSDQARAGILPTAAFQAGTSQTSFNNSNPDFGNNFNANNATIQASQPIYRPANWVAYEQGKRLVDIATAQLTLAEQDLVLRVTQAYFDVLAASDSLTFVRAQKVAVAEQLASAKRNFEVGTSTVTDSREAQARYDLVIAQEIAAENDLRVKKLALDQLVGRPNTEPNPLVAQAALPQLNPNDLPGMVSTAETTHPGVQQAVVNLDVARLETEKAKAGHKPTLDLTAAHTQAFNPQGSVAGLLNTHTRNTTVGLTFTLPLFSGFATQNRIKETLSLEDKAQADLDATRLVVSQATRAAFYGVLSGVGQVKALEAAEASSQSALDANRMGYQVGVRINIDVLNSQSQLFQTKRDLAKARYDVLVGSLKLRQANGTLTPQDLQSVNSLIAP